MWNDLISRCQQAKTYSHQVHHLREHYNYDSSSFNE